MFSWAHQCLFLVRGKCFYQRVSRQWMWPQLAERHCCSEGCSEGCSSAVEQAQWQLLSAALHSTLSCSGVFQCLCIFRLVCAAGHENASRCEESRRGWSVLINIHHTRRDTREENSLWKGFDRMLWHLNFTHVSTSCSAACVNWTVTTISSYTGIFQPERCRFNVITLLLTGLTGFSQKFRDMTYTDL